jgi:general secretion pathway protein G
MRQTQSPCGGRPAFTLIELLIVISIISILLALAAVAVMGAFSQGTQATNKVEIDQLASAVNLCKQDYGVPFLPSKIKLSETNNYPQRAVPGTDDYNTVTFLQQMFPKINLTPGFWIDWNGDNTKGPDITLYADQTLVFFVGGIPVPPGSATEGCLGFSTDPANPATKGGTRKGPYFDFVASRLRRQGNGFYRYVDQWKTNAPFLYLSTYGSENSYHMQLTPTRVSDATPAGFDVLPYLEGTSPNRFTNPKSFQIISAGNDGQFGPGGPWTPGSGAKYATGRPSDDQANFGGNILGTPNK